MRQVSGMFRNSAPVYRSRQLSDINISQGSVATRLRCGGIFNDVFIAKRCKRNWTRLWVKIKHPHSLFVTLAPPLHSAMNSSKSFYYNLPPHLNSVAALPCEIPCEIWMFNFNYTTTRDSHSIQTCAKSFIFRKYLYRDDMFSITRLCWLIYNSLLQCVFKTSTHICDESCTPLLSI